MGRKDFIDGLADLNLPIATNLQLGGALLGKSLYFGHRVEIDDYLSATKAR